MSKKDTLHIYVRCSTDSQIQNSIDRQISMGEKFSKEINMKPKIWSDGGKSGIKSFEDTREQFSQLMYEIELGVVKHLWCEDFTRLTRNYEDQVRIEKMTMDNDIFIYEGLMNNQIYEPNELSQRLIKVVTSLVGTDQKKKEIQKSINQKIIKFKQGFYVRGNVPYGFNKVDGYLVENEDESKWVKKMFIWYSDGKSLSEIQKKCKVNGLKTKRGNDFSSESISILLRNIEYTGKTHYTDMTKDPHRTDKNKHPYPDETKWELHINDNLPRIINDELFDKVSNSITKLKTKPTNNIYFLHGKMKCDCGCDWVGRIVSRKGTKYPNSSYYICSNSDRYYQRNRQGREHLYRNVCDKPKRLNTNDIDDYVWRQLLDTLRNSSFIKERVKSDLLGGKYDTTSSRRMVNKKKKELNKELKSLEQSRVQLLKEKFILKLSDMDFNDINSSILSKISELKTELEKENQREVLLDKRSEWIDWISQHHKDVDEYQKVNDVKKRRKILDIYIDKVGVKYFKETQQHNVDIHFRYPLVNDGIEYTKNKDSKTKWDKWGNSYRVKKGDNIVSLSDLKGSTLCVGKPYSTVTDLGIPTQTPYLTFVYRHRTHEFVYRRKLSVSHQKLHNLITKMKYNGLGYRKISKELNKQGIKSKNGKEFYPSLVSVIWKKIEKKQMIINQPILNEYRNFDIKFIG